MYRLGLSPALTQVAYRIGDSSTNIITPLMSYFAMIVVFMQKYKEDAGLGTLISMMLPYSITFLITWSLLMGVWIFLGLPVGPGAGLSCKKVHNGRNRGSAADAADPLLVKGVNPPNGGFLRFRTQPVLLTHHPCCAWIPPPLKRADNRHAGSALVPESKGVSPSVYPPFSRAGDRCACAMVVG